MSGDLSRLNEHQRASWAKAQRNARATVTAVDHIFGQHGPDCDDHELDRKQAAVFDAVRDLLWRLTPYGTTAGGDVAAYIVSKGTAHRLVGAMMAAGESAPLRSFPLPVGDAPAPKETMSGWTLADFRRHVPSIIAERDEARAERDALPARIGERIDAKWSEVEANTKRHGDPYYDGFLDALEVARDIALGTAAALSGSQENEGRSDV